MAGGGGGTSGSPEDDDLVPAVPHVVNSGDRVAAKNVPGTVSARTAQEVNVEEMSRVLGIPRTTPSSYLVALETIYAWIRLPAWSRNLSSKVVRHPKGHVSDSGLAAHLFGVSPEALASPDAIAAGPLVETFVVGELVRQRAW